MLNLKLNRVCLTYNVALQNSHSAHSKLHDEVAQLMLGSGLVIKSTMTAIAQILTYARIQW
ncbi:uncharacterized protein PHALS_14760 [Plasmopara halstedii]|uniref:Uncharacterized protein n=1 Tax=Plasmopara halstedii TaxID=4781 RepID=A0A0P1AQS8_PLAHL|nr:uncharacterized protein PHALS_14760 [Plasmopara halstedii]CEG43946.1 hypothetical protein PHALS_14760 [Plasmopara halstedii]|eukprot:XP_024580315.1 hypothetical protein PHALS_14760 [Plasmopara halstedii]